MSQEDPKGIKTPLPKDFDTTAELWDRITDELAQGRTPCIDLVEELKEDAENAG